MHRGNLYLKTALSVSVLCMLSGCAGQAMNRAIASWQGRQITEVVAAWGQPSEELHIEGKRLLVWNSYDASPAAQSSAPSKTASCVRLLHADRKGKIVAGAWDGNDCPGWFSGWSR